MNMPIAGRWIHPAFEPLNIDRSGPFLNHPDGRLITVGPEGIMLSADEGRTWAETLPAPFGQNPVKEPASCYLQWAPDGSLVMVYLNLADYKFDWDEAAGEPRPTSRLEMNAVRSADGGRTWGDKTLLLDGYNANFFGFIRLRSGRLVASAEHLLSNPGRWGVCSFISDDSGKSWRRSNIVDLGGHGHHDGATEPTLAELSDGRVLMLIRTNLDRFWQAISEDGGRYWREIRPTTLDASSSPGHLVRLRSGRLLFVWNRLNPESGSCAARQAPGAASEVAASWFREELSAAFSEDDGRSWSRSVVIARQTGGHISYPHVFERRPGEVWIGAGFAFLKGWENPVPLRLKTEEKKLLAAFRPDIDKR